MTQPDTELVTDRFPTRFQDWPADSVAAIDKFYDKTVSAAEERVRWYNEKAGRMGLRSRRLRLAAIVAGTIGTLLPLIHAASGVGVGNEAVTWGALGGWGYVALALAGAFIAADRAFGYSTSWIRYRAAEIEIGKRIVAFRYDWAIEMCKLGGRLPNSDEVASLLELQREFVTAVENRAAEETQDWIREFKSSLSELAKAYRKEGAELASVPGMLDISIVNADEAEGPIRVFVDDRYVGIATDGTLQIGQVVPGPHAIRASARIAGRDVSASRAIDVSSNVAAVPLTLE